MEPPCATSGIEAATPQAIRPFGIVSVASGRTTCVWTFPSTRQRGMGGYAAAVKARDGFWIGIFAQSRRTNLANACRPREAVRSGGSRHCALGVCPRLGCCCLPSHRHITDRSSGCRAKMEGGKTRWSISAVPLRPVHALNHAFLESFTGLARAPLRTLRLLRRCFRKYLTARPPSSHARCGTTERRLELGLVEFLRRARQRTIADLIKSCRDPLANTGQDSNEVIEWRCGKRERRGQYPKPQLLRATTIPRA